MGVIGTVAGAVGSALWKGTKAAAGVGWAGTKKVIGTAADVSLTALDYTAAGMYKAGKGMVKGGAYLAKDAYKARNERGMNNLIGKEIHQMGAMAKGMGDWQDAKDVYNATTGKLTHHDGKFKLSPFGKAAFFGPAAVAGAVGAGDQYMNERVGRTDGQVATATPVIAARQYSVDTGGATGDLVFALHKNRHG